MLGAPSVDERLAIATEALELAEQSGDLEGAIWCRNMRVYDLTILGDAVPSDPGFEAIFAEYSKYLLGRVADLVGI